MYIRANALEKVRFVSLLLLPRPSGLRDKGEFFWLGFFIAFPFSHFGSSELVPVLLSGLVHFFVLELLLQQAKFMWNDWRDRKHDLNIPKNQDRQSHLLDRISPNIVKMLIGVRLGVALISGFALSNFFFALMMVIVLHQLIYELLLKPRSEKYPVLFLSFLCFNLPLRILCGYASLLPIHSLADIDLLSTLLVAYLMSWSSLSNLYFVEARQFMSDKDYLDYSYTNCVKWFTRSGFQSVLQGKFHPQNHLSQLRLHSQFFYENGKALASLALYPSILVTLALLLQTRDQWISLIFDITWGVIFSIATILMPVTIRRDGLGHLKSTWQRLKPLIYVYGALGSIVSVIFIMITAEKFWSAWLIFLYSFYHYMRYIEDPYL